MSLIKNLRLSLAIVPLLALSIMGNAVANAAVANDGKSATTATNLTLLEKSGVVDPLDPSKPVQPKESFTPTTGDVRIDYISELHFGLHEISGSAQIYYAAFDQVADLTGHRDKVTGAWKMDEIADTSYRNVPNFVQVTNNTTGTWLLSASNTQFETANGDELKGAILEELDTTPYSADADAMTEPIQTSDLLLKGNSLDDSQLVNTDGVSDNPTGTWTVAFGDTTPGADDPKGNKSVKLVVPGTAQKVKDEVYTSTLTWTLIAAP